METFKDALGASGIAEFGGSSWVSVTGKRSNGAVTMSIQAGRRGAPLHREGQVEWKSKVAAPNSPAITQEGLPVDNRREVIGRSQ